MPSPTQIIHEELVRSVVWAGLGMIGWALAIAEFQQVPGTPLTAFGMPILTWAFLTVTTISVRLWTGRDLQVQSSAGLGLVLGVAVAACGFAAVYAVVGLGYPVAWVGLLYGSVALLTLAWLRYIVVPALEPDPLLV